MKRYNFTLKRSSKPVINNTKEEVTEQKAGGIKLEYDVRVTDNIHMRIGKRDIYIPYWRFNKQTLVFFKPLKAQWDFKSYKLANNFRGTPDNLMTNLWLILKSLKGNTDCYDDIVNIRKDHKSIRVKTLCTKKEHHQLIKHLDKTVTNFSIPYVQLYF